MLSLVHIAYMIVLNPQDERWNLGDDFQLTSGPKPEARGFW